VNTNGKETAGVIKRRVGSAGLDLKLAMTFAEFEARSAAVGGPPFSVTLNHYGGEAASRLVFLLFCNAVGIVVRSEQVLGQPRCDLRVDPVDGKGQEDAKRD
jgi:hypothetical protein